MPDELPQYIGNQSIQPGPMVDASPIYEGYQNLFNNIEKETSGVAQNIVDQKAVEQGSQDGQNINFKPTLSLGEASQKYNQAALEANRYTAASDAMQHVDTLAFQNSQNINKNTIQNFRNQMASYSDGLLSTIPQQNRGYIKNILTYKATRSEQHLQTLVLSRDKAIGAASFMDTYDTYSNQMNNAIQSGDIVGAASFHGQMKSAINSASQNGYLSPSQAVLFNKNLDKSFYEGHANASLQSYLNNSKDDPSDTIENANKMIDKISKDGNINKTLSPVEKNTLINNLHSQIQDYVTQFGINKANVNQTSGALEQQAYNNGDIDQQKLAEVQQFLPPDKFQNLQNSIQLNENGGALLSQGKNASFQTMSGLQDQINDKYQSAIKSGDPDAIKVATKVQKDFANLIKTKQNDPMSIIQNLPGYQSVLSQHNSNPDITPETSISQYSINLQKQWGLQPSQIKPVTNSQAQLWATQLNGDSPQQMVQDLSNMKSQMGSPEVFHYLLNQMQGLKSGALSTDVSTIYSASRNPDTSGEVPNLVSSQEIPLSELSKELSSSKSTKFSDVQNQVSQQINKEASTLISQQSLSPSILNPIKATTSKLAAYYMIKNGLDSNTAIQKASQVCFSDHFNTGTLNGNNVIIPKYDFNDHPVDPTNALAIMRMGMDEVMKGPITPPSNFYTNLDPKARLEQYQADVAGGGHWINKGNTGFILVDSANNPVNIGTQKEPKFMVKNLSDIANPSSSDNTKLAAILQSQKGDFQKKQKEQQLAQTIFSNKPQTLIGNYINSPVKHSNDVFSSEGGLTIQQQMMAVGINRFNRFKNK